MGDWGGTVDLSPGQLARLRLTVRPVNPGVGLVVVSTANPGFSLQWDDASGSFRAESVGDIPDWVEGIETSGNTFALRLRSDAGGLMLAMIQASGCELETATLAVVG